MTRAKPFLEINISSKYVSQVATKPKDSHF